MTSREGTFVYHGCCCCYNGCDFQNIVICCIGECDCLCIRHAICCSINSKPLGCGMTTNEKRGECCKVGCFCCDCGLITPTKLCAQASQQLCCFGDEYMSKCVCAYLFIQCCPECGVCEPAQECKALDALLKGDDMPNASSMER